jgi:hypothetical protein
VFSKPIGHDDESGAAFAKEMLKGDPTYGINFDRIQWHTAANRYVIVEYLLCDEKQFERGVTPYTSHPNRYFEKNSMKFLSLWRLARKLDAVLYLVNYSKKGTKYENEVMIMEVEYIDPKLDPIVKTKDYKLTREQYSDWFRELNKQVSVPPS